VNSTEQLAERPVTTAWRKPQWSPDAQDAARFAGVLLAAFIPFLLFRTDPFWIGIVTMTYLMGALASAWNIIGGFGGQFSMAHGVFFGIGAYIAAQGFIGANLSPWLTAPLAAATVALLAALIAWPAFRLRGPFFAIATMALNEVTAVIANYASDWTGGAQGLFIPFRASLANMIFIDRWKYALLMFAYLALTLAIIVTLRRGRLGFYLLAVREDEDTARAAGVNVLAVKLQGMAISAALTAIGGVLFTMYVRFIDPPTLFSLPDIGVKFALLALIGGIGTTYGPLLGAALLIPLENYIRIALGGLPGAHLVVLGLLLILGALFLKRGVAGALTTAWRRLRC
jgi:branched-chain amino acid transport system permease protein